MVDNVSAIVEYFRRGIKDSGESGHIGVEIEHTVATDDMKPVSYAEPYGVRWVLQELAKEMPERTFSENDNLVGVAKDNEVVTLEPAAQLELSAGPYANIGEIRLDCEEFERKVASILAPYHKRLLAVGYHPTAKSSDLVLIPKERYRLMDAYFAGIGRFGRCMMRGSASTQVSIDYFSVEDCLRKLRLASALAPVFALICDNAMMFEGAPRKHHMVRTEIWRKCDPDRCNSVPGVFDPNFSLERYAEYILRTPAIFYVDDEGVAHATEKTFGEVYADRAMNTAEIEHALSMFFNDVRLKTYIEIRPADAMPIPFVTAYAALVKGLFYDESNLDALDELLADVDANAVEQAKSALMQSGYDANVYGRPVGEIVDQLFALARKGLLANERGYLGALSQLARTRRTLAMLGEKRK